jgi:hypothetical protein
MTLSAASASRLPGRANVELRADPTDECRSKALCRQHPAQEERDQSVDTDADRIKKSRETYVVAFVPSFGPAIGEAGSVAAERGTPSGCSGILDLPGWILDSRKNKGFSEPLEALL